MGQGQDDHHDQETYEPVICQSTEAPVNTNAITRNTDSINLGSKNKQRPSMTHLIDPNEATNSKIEYNRRKSTEEAAEAKSGKVIKFGWFEGVYMRCLLNIWGVMLFLRLTWVVGQAGVIEGIAVITLANIVTVITTISMSAVCTNGQIKAGGIYYMISRTLVHARQLYRRVHVHHWILRECH